MECAVSGSADRSKFAFARAGLALTLTAGTTFWIAIYWEWGYPWYLGLWFLFFLSAQHTVYAGLAPPTIRHIRKMDYFYLGIAALGVLVAGSGYEEKRSVYYSQLNIRLINQEAASVRRALEFEARFYARDACSGQRDLAEYCERASALELAVTRDDAKAALLESRKLEAFLSRMDWQIRLEAERTRYEFKSTQLVGGMNLDPNFDPLNKRPIAEHHTSIGKPTARLFEIASGVDLTVENRMRLNQRGRNVLEKIQRMEEFWIRLIAAMPPAPRLADEFTLWDFIIGLGQTALWPFILAVAFAVRLTKVTIEVFEWAK